VLRRALRSPPERPCRNSGSGIWLAVLAQGVPQFIRGAHSGAPEEIRIPDLRIRRLVSVSEVRTVLVYDFCSGSFATRAAASKPGHARYAAESGSKFRAASQLMHLVKVARAQRLDFRRPAG
jgi:hypothetical protein